MRSTENQRDPLRSTLNPQEPPRSTENQRDPPRIKNFPSLREGPEGVLYCILKKYMHAYDVPYCFVFLVASSTASATLGMQMSVRPSVRLSVGRGNASRFVTWRVDATYIFTSRSKWPCSLNVHPHSYCCCNIFYYSLPTSRFTEIRRRYLTRRKTAKILGSISNLGFL